VGHKKVLPTFGALGEFMMLSAGKGNSQFTVQLASVLIMPDSIPRNPFFTAPVTPSHPQSSQ